MKDAEENKKALINEMERRRQQVVELKGDPRATEDPLLASLQCRNIIEFLPDATFVIDRKKRVIAWNKAMEEMTGVQKKDILGKDDHAYSIPFYGQRRPILIDLVIESDPSNLEDYDLIEKRGNTLCGEVFVPLLHEGAGAYLSGTASPIYDDAGNITGAIESIRDITEQKRAEKELKSSEKSLRILFDSAPDAYYLYDLQGFFVDGNRASEIISGYRREELIGKNFLELELLSPEQIPRAIATLNKSAQGFPSGPDDFTLIRKDGKRVVLEIRTIPTTIKGRMLILSIARDVTDRKRTEEALRNSERELKHLSARLLTAQEEERKKISRELHDSIGSSLNAMKIFLENTLNSPSPGGDLKETFTNLILTTQGIIKETRRIMTDLRPSVLDDFGIIRTINWFCKRFQSFYQGVSVDEHIQVKEKDIPDHLKIVIFRIIQEALTNVAKHSRATHVDISLSERDHSIELHITDNGSGFDLNTHLSREHAVCFGLTSMRERAKLSGGRFSIKTAPADGTTIHVSWPLSED
jgi:PAS domain S-box-containing protein